MAFAVSRGSPAAAFQTCPIQRDSSGLPESATSPTANLRMPPRERPPHTADTVKPAAG